MRITSGAIPKTLDLIVWSGANESGEPIGSEKLSMENLGAGKFSATLARLEKTLRYRAATGAFSSRGIYRRSGRSAGDR